MPKYIKNEPNWENMFEVTKSIVNSSDLPKGQCNMVIEMLDYGKRLHIKKEKLNEYFSEEYGFTLDNFKQDLIG